jgi:hypothetical protein
MSQSTRVCAVCHINPNKCSGYQRVANCEIISQRCGRCKQVQSVNNFAPSYRGKNGTWCRPCFSSFHRREPAPVVQHDARMCDWCRKSYIPRNLKMSTSYCSRQCKSDARNARIAADTLAAKALLDRRCLQCAGVIPVEAHSHAVFCSEQCSSSAHMLQRKLRVRSGRTEKPGHLRAKICERDNWICGLCYKPVDRTLKHPDPLCPSLDHIVPVSLGGSSEESNLQLTHLVCNLRRRNVSIVEVRFFEMLREF